MGSADLSAYFGSTVKGYFGQGRKFAGAAIAWNIDSGSQRRSQRSLTDDVKPKTADASVTTADSKKPAGPARSDYPEMDATEIDPLADFSSDGQDDFSAIEAKMKADAKNATPSQIEVVERELSQIRETESKAEQARLKAEQNALDKSRAEKVKAAKNRSGSESKQKKDAEAEAAKLDGITDDEMTWMGLE